MHVVYVCIYVRVCVRVRVCVYVSGSVEGNGGWGVGDGVCMV